MKKEILTRPFGPEQVKQRKGQQGKTLSYVDVAAVIERLNEAFDHAWTFEVAEHHVYDAEVVVLGRLTAGGVTKMAFGGSSVTVNRDGEVVSIADDLKAAASDSVKKCASLLGVALELYGGAPAEAARPPAKARAPAPSPAEHQGPENRLTTRQLTTIHSASRRHGIGKDRLAQLVDRRFHKQDLSALTRSEASSLITELTEANGTGR